MNKTKKVCSKKKNPIKILYGLGLTSLIVAPISIVLSNNFDSNFVEINKNNQNLSVSLENQDASAFSTVRPLMPAQFVSRNPLITAETGPIISWGEEIFSVDWFGTERWRVNIKDLIGSLSVPTWWRRSWINWSYNRTENLLYVMSIASRNQYQKLIIIDVVSGQVKKNIDITRNLGNENNTVDGGTAVGLESTSISQLDSGEILAFGSAKFTNSITNLNTNRTRVFNGINSWNQLLNNQPDYTSTSGDNDRPVPQSIIPLSNNVNLAIIKTLKVDSTIFALVDDNVQPIYNNSSSPWGLSKKVITNTIKPTFKLSNGQYHRLLNGNTIFIVQDCLFVFNPSKISSSNFGFAQYKFPKNVTSWSIDTNEDLYIKYENDTKIYRSQNIKNISENSFDGVERSSDSLGISTYYDMNGSIYNEVRDNSELFQIYALPGYFGSLMLISGLSEISPTLNPTNTNSKYGIMLAITKNANNPSLGDSPGLINTEKSFANPADFNIDNSVLNKKLPSEIIASDLTLLNKGFFTENVSKNPDGTLKYPPFTKLNINDETRNFVVEVYLDQVPWFTNTLPVNSIPLKISKHFDTVNGINSRISWKKENFDYDFLNTLPSKIETSDLNRFDPFLIDLTSQVVIDSDRKQLYPKKEYRTISQNDTTGEVTVECQYSYMPLGVAIEEKNVLTYSFNQSFTIFKSSDIPVFNWNTDGTGSSTTSTISNVPSLKKLTEANILPSSVKANDQNQLLEFINRNTSIGYPISKMRATITPNDNTGTLSIVITLPASYYGTERTFTHLYTGLNKLNNYTFNYSLPTGLTNLSTSVPTTENTSASLDYTKVLPSSVGEEQIFADFVKYGGYNSLDLVTTLLPNDSSGTLTVQFELTNNYPSSVSTINTFSLVNGKTISTITIGNFLTTSEFQSQYVVSFKNNNDLSLNAIKNMEVNTIVTKLNEATGLTVEGKTYHSKEELVELFIASKGVSIPTIVASNVSMYTDNESGLLTFELFFSSSETGLNYPLSFTQTFSGFIQGVAVPTSDIFIFKNQNALDATLLAKLPSAIANELKVNPTLIKDYFVQTLAGEFVSLVTNSTNFTIETFANDLTGTLGISIEFKNVTNSQTLKLYSKSYVGFSTV